MCFQGLEEASGLAWVCVLPVDAWLVCTGASLSAGLISGHRCMIIIMFALLMMRHHRPSCLTVHSYAARELLPKQHPPAGP